MNYCTVLVFMQKDLLQHTYGRIEFMKFKKTFFLYFYNCKLVNYNLSAKWKYGPRRKFNTTMDTFYQWLYTKLHLMKIFDFCFTFIHGDNVRITRIQFLPFVAHVFRSRTDDSCHLDCAPDLPPSLSSLLVLGRAGGSAATAVLFVPVTKTIAIWCTSAFKQVFQLLLYWPTVTLDTSLWTMRTSVNRSDIHFPNWENIFLLSSSTRASMIIGRHVWRSAFK